MEKHCNQRKTRNENLPEENHKIGSVGFMSTKQDCDMSSIFRHSTISLLTQIEMIMRKKSKNRGKLVLKKAMFRVKCEAIQKEE